MPPLSSYRLDDDPKEGLLTTDRELVCMLRQAADTLEDPSTRLALRRHAARIDAQLSLRAGGANTEVAEASRLPPFEHLTLGKHARSQRRRHRTRVWMLLALAAAVTLVTLFLSSRGKALSTQVDDSRALEQANGNRGDAPNGASVGNAILASTRPVAQRVPEPSRTSGAVSLTTKVKSPGATRRGAKAVPESAVLTLQRRAVDATIAGDFESASRLFGELSQQLPREHAYSAASTILSMKAQRRSRWP